MPLPRWLKLCWNGSSFCGRCALTLGVWTLWLVLVITAGVQIYIATAHRLAVPAFVLQTLSARLAESGLRVTFGGAEFDPAGHVLLRDVQVSFVNLPEPVLQADSVYCELDPIALWLRRVEPRQIRVSGAELLIPAMLSPSGTSEPFVQGLDVTLRPGETPRTILVDHLTTQVGPLPLDAHGALTLPASQTTERPPLSELLSSIAQNYVQACRRVAAVLPRLPPLAEPRLSLILTADADHIADVDLTFAAGQFVLALPDQPVAPELRGLRLHAALPLGGRARLLQVDFTLDALTESDRLTARDLVGRLDAMVAVAANRFEPRLLELSARSVAAAGVTLEHPSLQASMATLPQVQAQLVTQVFGEPLHLRADLDVLTRAGRIEVETNVSPAFLRLAEARTGKPITDWINWDLPPAIEAQLDLGEGGKPLRGEAELRIGPILAYHVPLDSGSAHVDWSGTRLAATNAIAYAGSSRATGSYTMDFSTLDFRFLLRGHLAPLDISGWFHEWWPDLWSNFDFSRELPEARVEVSGRWKSPLDTQVWVQAEGHHAGVKDIAMDHMRTRLFVRPGWVDVLEFIAERPTGEVRGAFARQWRMPDGRRWTLVEVHAEGDSDLSPAPKLLGALGDSIIAPFTLSQPMHIKLNGKAWRDDFGAPIHTDFAIDGQTTGDWTFLGFPLQNVDFHADQNDSRLLIAPFHAQAAHGDISGRIELSGSAPTQQVAFDLNLERARLGESIRTASLWLAARNGERAAPVSSYEQRIADGVLNLSLSAQGPASDAFSYQGEGSAAIENADLGELKLLGILSSLLGNSLLGFSKMQLNNANADFQLDRQMLRFPSVRITGRKGAIDANGTYNMSSNRLDFLTRVRPFEGSQSLLDAVFTPLTNVLEVKLSGQLNAPEWNFVFGPTNLFRSLTGDNRPDRVGPLVPVPAPPVAPPTPPAPPPTTETVPPSAP